MSIDLDALETYASEFKRGYPPGLSVMAIKPEELLELITLLRKSSATLAHIATELDMLAANRNYYAEDIIASLAQDAENARNAILASTTSAERSPKDPNSLPPTATEDT